MKKLFILHKDITKSENVIYIVNNNNKFGFYTDKKKLCNHKYDTYVETLKWIRAKKPEQHFCFKCNRLIEAGKRKQYENMDDYSSLYEFDLDDVSWQYNFNEKKDVWDEFEFLMSKEFLNFFFKDVNNVGILSTGETDKNYTFDWIESYNNTNFRHIPLTKKESKERLNKKLDELSSIFKIIEDNNIKCFDLEDSFSNLSETDKLKFIDKDKVNFSDIQEIIKFSQKFILYVKNKQLKDIINITNNNDMKTLMKKYKNLFQNVENKFKKHKILLTECKSYTKKLEKYIDNILNIFASELETYYINKEYQGNSIYELNTFKKALQFSLDPKKGYEYVICPFKITEPFLNDQKNRVVKNSFLLIQRKPILKFIVMLPYSYENWNIVETETKKNDFHIYDLFNDFITKTNNYSDYSIYYNETSLGDIFFESSCKTNFKFLYKEDEYSKFDKIWSFIQVLYRTDRTFEEYTEFDDLLVKIYDKLETDSAFCDKLRNFMLFKFYQTNTIVNLVDLNFSVWKTIQKNYILKKYKKKETQQRKEEEDFIKTEEDDVNKMKKNFPKS